MIEWYSWVLIFSIPFLVYWLLLIALRQECKRRECPSLLESMCKDTKWYDPRIYGDNKF